MVTGPAAGSAGSPATPQFRRPVEADHPRLLALLDDAWGARRLRHLLPRVWIRHFAGTSWIAVTPVAGAEPRLAGFVVGFDSPDHPGEACVHLMAVDGNLRRRGIGRALVERFAVDAGKRGVRVLRTVAWPGDRIAVEFLRAVGFHAEEGPGTRRMWGVPAYPDYDDDGDDRAVFLRELASGS